MWGCLGRGERYRKLLHGPFYFAEYGSAAPCEVVPMLLDGMSFSNRSDRKVRAMEGLRGLTPITLKDGIKRFVR
jgi:hypothetical protein